MRKTQSFDHSPESVPLARRFVSSEIKGAPADIAETVALMTSELAANCVRHTDVGFEVTVIRTSSEIRIEATDRSAGEPELRSPAPTDPDGRGLQIINMLAAAWGVQRREDGGKTVWFSVPLPQLIPAYVPSVTSGVHGRSG